MTAPRIPCANFAAFWGVPDLIKRFTARGATGAYLRVLATGDLVAGDDVDIVWRPDHGVTTGAAFRMLTTEAHRLPELAPALHFLPVKAHAQLHEKITARSGTSA